jgi:hypothetical protein
MELNMTFKCSPAERYPDDWAILCLQRKCGVVYILFSTESRKGTLSTQIVNISDEGLFYAIRTESTSTYHCKKGDETNFKKRDLVYLEVKQIKANDLIEVFDRQ